MTMAKVSAAQRKHIRDQKATARLAARHARILQVKRGKPPEIPTEVLRKIASLGLPNNRWLYDLVLRELTRGV
jgi:hypothetical protein